MSPGFDSRFWEIRKHFIENWLGEFMTHVDAAAEAERIIASASARHREQDAATKLVERAEYIGEDR